jgi:hypothetical protein
MFRITGDSGFHMTFENGWTISVQFGIGYYCDNRNYEMYTVEADRQAARDGCVNAEIAGFSPDGKMYDFDTDTVKGWVSADEVLTWMNKFANMPRE